MSNLQLIWALFKKNVLRTYWSGGAIFMVSGLVVSVIDWKFPLQEQGWLEVFFGVWCISISAGLTTFNTDLKRDNIRFLEYLPVRRPHIWLANYGDGFLSLAALILAIVWRRTLLFEPAGQPDSTLFAYRWNLLIGMGSVSFWSYSFGVFGRVLFERDLFATAMTTSVACLLWIGGSIFFLDELALFPSFVDLAPVLCLSGVLFSLASLQLFVFVHPRYPRWVQPLAFGLPVLLVLILVGMVHFYLCALNWKELSGDDRQHIYRAAPLTGTAGGILASVASSRSSEHTVRVDPETGQYHDLGRDLEWSGSQSSGILAGDSGSLSFLTHRAPNGLWRVPLSLILMSPEGNRCYERILAADHTHGHRWSADAKFVVFVETRSDYSRLRSEESTASKRSNFLVVADRSGSIRARVAISSEVGQFYLSRSGRVLAVAPYENEQQAEQDTGPNYILLDLPTLAERRFRLTGTVMNLAPDLSRAACLRTRTLEGRQYQSVVVVDLATQAEQPLLSEEDIPSAMIDKGIAPHQIEDGPEYSSHAYANVHVDSFSENPSIRFLPQMLFNAKFDRAVTVTRKLEGELMSYAIIALDVASGQKRVLVPPSDLPKHNVITPMTSYSIPTFFGFLPDDNRLIYMLGDTLFLLDTSSGERQQLAKTEPDLKGDSSDEFRFSPNRSRVFVQRDYRVEGQHFGKLETFPSGYPRQIYSSKFTIRSSFWLDEEQIAFVEENRVLVIHADGTGLRQLFPPAR